MAITVLLSLLLASGVVSQVQPAMHKEAPAVPDTYGSAAIQAIHAIDTQYTILCDIADFPPVVGRNIPVRLRGLDAEADNPNPLVLEFLQDTLLSRTNEPNSPPILLKDIQRGPTFCLVADIEIDGTDLGTLMVENGLVKRVLRAAAPDQPESGAPLPAQRGQTNPISPAQVRQTNPVLQSQVGQTKPISPPPAAPGGFVASRTGKVFHRPDCSHAKRISEERKVTFQTRQQAESSGRRPCKTCSP